LASLAIPASADAQLQWDPGATPASPSGGAGTWTGAATTNWSNGTTDVAWDSNNAVFGGTAGTVSIDGVASPSAAGMAFNTTGYTLAAGGGTITVTGGSLGNFSGAIGVPTIGVSPNLSATINAVIGGAGTVYVGQGNTTAYPGTLTLGGANTFAGGVNITGGATLTVSSDANFGTAPASVPTGNNGNILMNGGTLHIPVGFALGTTRVIAMPDGGVAWNGVQQIGGGGTIVVDSGTFAVSTPFVPASTVCTIGGAGNTTITGKFSCFTPNGHLIKNGSGTLTLNNSNNSGSLTSDITVNGGILQFDQSNSFGNTSQPVTLNGGELDDTRTSSATFINANRAIVIGLNGGTIKLTNATATTQTYTPSATGGLQGSGAFTLTGVAANAGSTLLFAGSATGAANTNTGSTTINNATLSIGGSNATNWLSASSAVILSNGGKLNIAGFSQTIASLSDGAGAFGSVLIGNLVGGVLTLGGDNSSTTFTGVISGSASTSGGGLTKIGTGTFTLASPTGNTYGSGASITTVSGGTLLVTNTSGSATGNGIVNVTGTGTLGSGGTLGGTGSISGLITVSSTTAGSQGGIVYPGPGAGSAGTLNAGSMTWDPLGRNVFAYNSNDATVGSGVNSLINGTGSLDLSNLSTGNLFDLNLLPLSPSPSPVSQTYTLATFAGGITLPAGQDPTNLNNLLSYSGTFVTAPKTFVNGNSLQVTFISAVVNGWTWFGGTSGNWSGAGNWNPASVPPSGPNTQLIFGATANPTMTNDVGVQTLNSMYFLSTAPAGYALTGNGLTFQTSTGGVAPKIVQNASSPVAINTAVTLNNTLTVSGSGNLTLGGAVSGPGGLTMIGPGTLTLTNSPNTYSGGTSVQNGIVSVASDAALGTGNVTGAVAGTLAYSNSVTTTRSFAMNGGTVNIAAGKTLTFNGSSVANAYLDGAGSFVTGAAGAAFNGVTTTPSVALTSASTADQFVHFTNGGSITFSSGPAAAVSVNGFVNQGSGAVTLGQNSLVNAANLQSYGTLTLNPGTFNGTTGNVTQLTNTGNSNLSFNSGSRTFISTVAQVANGNAGIDLHGHDAIVAGGLFVNNGFVYDSVGSGTHRVVADYGALVKGAGFYQPLPRTINGGTFIAGNSPGHATTGTIVLGGPNDPNGGLSDFSWQINNAGPSSSFPSATGVSGPSANAAKQVSGWGTLLAVAGTNPVATAGNFQWDATPADKLTIHLQTLLAPHDSLGNSTTAGGYGSAGDMTPGPMSDFAPTQSYSWRLFAYSGNYTGPTDTATLDASTNLDTSGFLNPHAGRFDLVLNPSAQEMDLVFTPTAVPEPGTLMLVGLAGLAVGWRLRRLRQGRSSTRLGILPSGMSGQ
jgi:autotransporter-associated beta strand protein